MKNKLKRIISLLITVCMLLPLMPVMTASAYDIGLDCTDYVYNDWDQRTFTPEESGFYRFKWWHNGSAFSVYDGDYNYVNALFQTEHMDEMDWEYGMSPQSSIYYFEEAMTYTFEFMGISSSVKYVLSREYVNDLGEYTIGESVSAEVSGTNLAVIHYTAAETKEVLFSIIGLGCVNVYDIYTGNVYGSGWDSQLNVNVEEGNEYYIILGSHDSTMWESTTLTSSYVEPVDNSTVETSNVEEMQSSHPYPNNLDKSWVYYAPEGTIYNKITFDSSCFLTYYDELYIYDADGNQIKYYNYTYFGDVTLTIPGDKFTIRLVTDETSVAYGFALASVESYSKVEPPVASLESGKVRPHNVTVKASSAATIYYKLSTAESEGEFAQYSSAISITEDCTLELYAKIGDMVSETVTYNYTIDNSPVPVPEISKVGSTASYTTLKITAAEGDIYYRKMTSGYSYYKLTSGGQVNVYESDTIAAYAKVGTLKSEVVYYSCEVTDNRTYGLLAPIITETPIMGGKRVTVSIPEGFEFINDEEYINYCGSHLASDCESNPHEMGPWSTRTESTNTYVRGGNAQGDVGSGYYYEAADFPRIYEIYENTAFSAQSEYNYSSESGEWVVYDPTYGHGGSEYYQHELYHPEYGSSNYTSDYKQSPRSYRYVEVPKAEKPEFAIIDGKLHITAAEGMSIYFRVNDGLDVDYTEPIEVQDGDVIYAHALGMGVAESDEAEYTVELKDVMIKDTAVLGGYEIEITSAKANAELYYSTDGESYTAYTEKLFISEDTTLSAYAVIDGVQSENENLSVTVPRAAAPEATHQSGKILHGTLIGFTANEQIYMIINGEEIPYAESITLTENMTISVYAIGMGIAKSDVVDFEYKVLKAEVPTISENNIWGGKSISITTDTEGGSIWYKIDDGEYVLYSEPFEINKSTKIYAYTALEGTSNSETAECEVNVPQAADPVPGYAFGEVFSGTQIELASDNGGAETKIYYTLDGSEPSEESTLYEGGITITEPTTIRAIAYAMGHTKSKIVTLNYTIKEIPKDVVIEGTAVLGGYEIEIVAADSAAELYYTTDGTNWHKYTEKMFVTEDTIVSAYAVADGKQSETETFSLTVPKATAPVASHESGTYIMGTKITFTNENPGEKIICVMGEETKEYTDAISLNDDMNISVYSIGIGIAKSEVADYSYVILRTTAPMIAENNILGGKSITISSATEGASIYYKIDNGEYVLYTEPFEVYDLAKIYAYTAIEGAADSKVTEHSVSMTQTADPVPNYASGEVFSGTLIELNSINDGLETVIYYTLDDTEPSMESTLYEGSITISEQVTIKAVAYAMGRAKSETVKLSYTLRTAKAPKITEQNAKGGKKIYLESETEGAAFYYTLDGTDPKVSETAVLYEAPFIVGTSGTVVRAYARSNGYLDSEISEHTVEIGQLPAPVFSVTEDNVYLNTSLTITADSFAEIYYTVDGADPTKESGTLYTEPIEISDDVTVKAVAVSDGWQTSNVTEKAYTVYVTGKPYIIKTKNGDAMKIELKSETPDATIYYTLDNTEPTNTSAVYKDAILLSADTTIKAFAVSEKRKASEIYTEAVLVRHVSDPVASIPSGEIRRTDKITLTSDGNATIHYTLDGTVPTEESPVYTEPFSLSANATLKAIAVQEGLLDSSVVTYEYTIKRVKNPEILLNEDILGGKSVKIESADSNATIYYTTDGSEPTTTSAVYTSPFNIYETTVIRALATLEGSDNSEIAYREMAVPVAPIYDLHVEYMLKGDAINSKLSSQTVYYTLDGSEPTLESGIYEPGTIVINENTKMRAFAIGYGYAKSKVISISYNITKVNVSTYVNYGNKTADIIISTIPTDAKVYYTLNGSDPSLETNMSRILYTGAFTITENTTIKIYAEADRYNSTSTSQMIYVNRADAPEIYADEPCYAISSWGEAAVKKGASVRLHSPEGLKIRYTLDGTTPTSENGMDYSEPIVVNDDVKIKAYCYGENYEDSAVKTFSVEVLQVYGNVSYKKVPGGKKIEIIPIAGFNTTYAMEMLPQFGEFTVYYTTDGTEPTKESKIYMQVNASGEYIVSPPEEWIATESVTVKTMVVSDGCITGKTVSEEIMVEKLNKPSYLPAETAIYKNSYITLETAETGAAIHYTTDGTDPTYESPVYEGPFTLEDDTTIKMIAVKSGMATSDMVEVNYTIKRVETPTYKSELKASGVLITLDCKTEGAKIYYTLNGDKPTAESTLYTEPFKLKKNTVLSFVAICDNMKESYTVSEVVNVPTDELSIVGISNVKANPGEYVDAMLYFQKNKEGVAAYAISVEYDSDVLTPVSAENLWGGIFTTNIDKGAQSGVENAVSMVWLNDTSIYESGNAAKITFKVSETAKKQTVPLYIKENGVINHLYEMVDVAYMDGSAEISGEAAMSISTMSLDEEYGKKTQYTDTKLSMTTNIENEKLTVKVMIDENSGIGAYNISMLYDNDTLTPVSAENGELFTSDLMSNVTQPGGNVSELSEITVLSCNDKDTAENGVLYTLTFDINSEGADGQMIGFSDVMLLDVSGNEIVGIYEDTTVDSEVKTTTTIESGMVKVTPHNVPQGSSIIVAGYRNGYLTFSKDFKNDNSTISFETPDVEFDTLRIYIWDSINNIKPLGTMVEEVIIKKTVTTVESGVVTVTPYDVPTGSSIIVAGYKNDYLTFSKNFKNDNNVISFEVPNVELDVIRVYVWDSLNGMMPLSTLFEEIPVN